jgi:hypothetical protein
MIQENLLGRYEYSGTTANGNRSDKYWHIIFDKTTRQYIAQWGRRSASAPQDTKVYSLPEARKKINEKINKGYNKVSGYQTTAGENSIHFILEDEAA